MNDVPPILIAEDEPLVRLSMVEALQDGGYTVVECAEGHSAIEQIDLAQHLRGLVTDVRMGSGPDGWQVARQAREKFSTLAIIYVTVDSFSEWSTKGVPQSTILQKPFADAELVAALANLLLAQQQHPPTEE